MFSDANLPEPNFITEIENPPLLSVITPESGIFFDETFTHEKRIRTYVLQMLLNAKAFLPDGYYFQVFEAYRSLDAQIELWKKVVVEQKALHPDLKETDEELIAICDVFCANPYRQGSGHQSGAAIDVSLCNEKGEPYDMGGAVRGFEQTADFDCPVSQEAKKNRLILRSALEKAGFVNYPSEWWHYSFGDRLWARLTGSKIAVFGKLNI